VQYELGKYKEIKFRKAIKKTKDREEDEKAM
jgi:hypothetical protein